MLNPEEQRPFPVDCTCYRGMVLIQWGVVEVLNKDFVNYVNLQSNQTNSISKQYQRASQDKIELEVCIVKEMNMECQEIQVQNSAFTTWSLLLFLILCRNFLFGLTYAMIQTALYLQTVYNHLGDHFLALPCGLWDISSPARNQTEALSSESIES